MKAAIKTADGIFSLEEADEPIIPTDNFVKVRVRVAGICGTDLRHWRKPEESLCGKITGHELAGEVVAVGDAVTNVKPGDRVVQQFVLARRREQEKEDTAAIDKLLGNERLKEPLDLVDA